MSDDPFEEIREGNEFVRRERERQRQALKLKWAKMLPVSRTIKIKWLNGEPEKPNPAQALVEVNGHSKVITVGEQLKDRDQYVFDPKVQRYGYKGAVEQWALWRWHTARGTPVDERDNLLLEPGFQAPEIVWEQPDEPQVMEEPKRRGRPKKLENAAST